MYCVTLSAIMLQILNTVIETHSVEQIDNILLTLVSNIVVFNALKRPEIIIKNNKEEKPFKTLSISIIKNFPI